MADRIDETELHYVDGGRDSWALYRKVDGVFVDSGIEPAMRHAVVAEREEHARRFVQLGREQLAAEIEKSVHIGDMVSVENYEHPHYANTHRWPVVITFEGDEGYWTQRGDTFVEALLLDPLEITKRNIAHDVKNGDEPFIPCPVCLQLTEKKEVGVDVRWECTGIDCDGVWAGEPAAWQPKSEPTPDELSAEGGAHA